MLEWLTRGSFPIRIPELSNSGCRPGKAGGSPTFTLVTALDDHLFDHRTQRGRYLLYNVGPLQRFGKLAVIALASTQADADGALERDLPLRLGIG